VHPGFTPDEPDVKRWNYGHEKELQALTSPLIRSEIAAAVSSCAASKI